MHNYKSISPKALLEQAAKNLPTSHEQQFYALLKNLMSAVSKDNSNNVAIVAIAAMFFAFAVTLLKPATPVINPPAINLQLHPTITVTTNQEQNQRIDRDSDTGS